MKLAICISGHLRTFRDTFESLRENVIKQISSEHDFFIYCSPDLDRGKWRARPDLPPQPLSLRDLEDANKLYSPRIMRIDPLNENNDLNCTPLLRRVKMCNDLVREYSSSTGTVYDAVLRVRPDTIFVEKMKIPTVIDDSKIFFLQYGRHHDGYYDGFALGSPTVMDKYSDFLNHADRLRRKSGDSGIKIEKALREYIEELNLTPEFIHTPSFIKRTWGVDYFFFDQDPKTYRFVPGKVHN